MTQQYKRPEKGEYRAFIFVLFRLLNVLKSDKIYLYQLEEYGLQSRGVYDNSNLVKNILKGLIIILFLVLVVATILGWEKVEDVESVFLSFSIVILILISLKTTGKYKPTAICYLIGVIVWFIGDICWAFDSIYTSKTVYISVISDYLYLIADYIFLGGAIIYSKLVFKRSDFQRIAVNAIIVGMLTSIGGYRFASDYYTFTSRISFDLIMILMYLFAAVSILIIEFMIATKTGMKDHSKAFYLIYFSMILFSLIELRYSFVMMMHRDPENTYLDILYYLILSAFAFALSMPDIKDTVITPIIKVRKKDNYIQWVNSGLIMTLSIVLYIFKIFSAYMVFAMLITILVYLIMFKTVQANALTEELLERQKNETARLEQMVEEKIKELREVNKNLEYVSNTDVLTGLYNRRYGMDYLEKLVKDGDNYPIALYSMDLNYFKPINDNFGHDVGDIVLKEVGRRLKNLKQERCTAIRMGGDEFLVVFRNATNEQAVRGIADLLCQAMDTPIDAKFTTEEGETKEHSFTISTSIGISEIPGDTNDIEELYKMADDALYKVKHTSEKSSYLMYREMDSFTGEKIY